MKTFRELITEQASEDQELAQNHIDDQYSTLDINMDQLKELFRKFIYSLPKKFSNKKEVFSYIKSNYPKAKPTKFKGYLEGLDESRLENLVGLVYDAIEDWDGVRRK